MDLGYGNCKPDAAIQQAIREGRTSRKTVKLSSTLPLHGTPHGVNIGPANEATSVRIDGASAGSLWVGDSHKVEIWVDDSGEISPISGPRSENFQLSLRPGWNVLPPWLFCGVPAVRFVGRPRIGKLYLRIGH